jgi:predicted lysophospholipase L1 biosynthesis ABC-type transport system permease subunit
LWDELLFSVAWLEKRLIVENIRRAVRSGATPFFYFSLYEPDFEKFPKRYFVSYKSENKPENTQFEYSQAVWWKVTFINAKEIIEIVLDVAQKVLLIVYFCLAYVTIFSFLTFVVSIWFLRSFKDSKLKLMHILWGQQKRLERAVAGEYIYLMLFGLSISVVLWTISLLLLEYYVEYFTLDMSSYLGWLGLVFLILWVMSLFLVLQKKTIK